MTTSRFPVGRLVLAIVASLVLVAAAPFVGELRSQIRAAFPERFSLIVNFAVAAAVLAAVAAGLRGIRHDRLSRRAGAVGLALALFGLYDQFAGSPDLAIRAVERFHFVEYGAITFLFFRVWRERADWSALALPAAAAFIVGVAEEGYQWFLPARVGELKDVWLNGVVIACGLLFSLGATPPASFRYGWNQWSIRLTARALTLAMLALAAFIQVVHVGVMVIDGQAGTFESYYRAERLAALDQERATAWKTNPPVARPPRFSREDQFTTEALQHVQARNKAWGAGDAFTAWRENLILEHHYPSVIGAPIYVAKGALLRWPAEQRADAEARVKGTDAQPFTSRAYPYPIYTWSSLRLWAIPVLAFLAAWIPWRPASAGRASSAG
jgi:VanZ family protein